MTPQPPPADATSGDLESAETAAHDVPDPEAPPTRAGYVTLAGLPNSGKSTLLNRLVGQKLSIVTAKAQTTWRQLAGIHTSESTQMILLDTPGLLEARTVFQRCMLHAALDALRDADVLLLVLDAARPMKDEERTRVVESISEMTVPILSAVNKIDVATSSEVEALEHWCHETLGARPLPVSALRGTGIDELRDALADALPRSPFLYPPGHLATEPVRFFVAELIRETVFERFRQEIPYSVMCRVEEFREADDPIYIHANIFVERNSQKGIVVGKKGAAIKALGRAARERIEAFLERSVYLDLWVKVLPDWRRKKEHLRRFGFRAPEGDEADITF